MAKNHLCVASFSRKSNRHKGFKGFTLAETLITLTILGIVAALTVPSLVRRQVEASNRVKIKKAVGVYDSMITKLTVSNNLKSNAAIQEWANDDCSNSSDLFKVVKFLKVDNVETKCKFKTADGVFWDISNIQKPIISLKEADLNDATAQSDTNRAFYLFAEYDGQGILRVTEPTYDYTLTADADAVNTSVDGLMDFLAGKTTTKLNEIANSGTESTGGEEGSGEENGTGDINEGNNTQPTYDSIEDFAENNIKENITVSDFKDIINNAKNNGMTVKYAECAQDLAFNSHFLLTSIIGQKAYAVPSGYSGCVVKIIDSNNNYVIYFGTKDTGFTYGGSKEEDPYLMYYEAKYMGFEDNPY